MSLRGIHLRANLRRMPILLFWISLKIIILKLLPRASMSNELTQLYVSVT